MCEHCQTPTVWGEAANPDDWLELGCEHPLNEDSPEECGNEVAYIVHFRDKEEHLCADCVATDNADLDTGLGTVYRAIGVQDGIDFLPIAEGELCQRIVGLRGEEPIRCGKPASYVSMVIDHVRVCHEHVRETGYTPPNED